MVHALQEIHRMLKPGGALIEIHPLPERPHLEAYSESQAIFSEPLQVSYLEGIHHAERALAQVVESGLFVAVKHTVIDFRHLAASTGELYDHWDSIEPYSDTPKEPAVAASEKIAFSRLESFLQTMGGWPEVAVRERARLSRYDPLKAHPGAC